MYLFPWKEDDPKNADILMVSGISKPCRILVQLVAHLKIPVDICGVDFSLLQTPEMTAINPIHSIPYMYNTEKKRGINGSEAIAHYLLTKYRSQIPESFW